MKAREYIKWQLQLEIDGYRSEIRRCKKIIRMVEELRSEVNRKSDTEIEAMLKDDPELYENYERCQKEFANVERRQLEEMRHSGKLREVMYNEKGEEIDEEGNLIENGRKVDPRAARAGALTE